MNKKKEKVEKKIETKEAKKVESKKLVLLKKRKNQKEYYFWNCLCLFHF